MQILGSGKVPLKKSVIEESYKSPRGAVQILGSGKVPLEKKCHRRVLQKSSRRCADTRKRGKYDQNKESSRSAEKIHGSQESTAKIKKVYNLTPI